MWESLHTVRQYLWRYRRGMALGGLCLVMKDLAQALQPLMIRGAVDSFRSGAAFVRFAGYLVGLALIKGIFQYWMRVILIGISRDIEFDLRNDLFAHLIRLSPEYYARTRTDDIMARATNDLRSEEHTSELQSLRHLVCRLLLEKKNKKYHCVLRHSLTAYPVTSPSQRCIY